MQFVTIISDYGYQGYRRGALTGALVKACPTARYIDINHDIQAFDIDEAAFVLKAVYKNYPKGTIHVVCVSNYYDLRNRIIFFEREGQYFVGPDNGLFSLVFDDLKTMIHAITLKKDREDFKKQISRIVALISSKAPLIGIGMQIQDARRKLSIQPVIADNHIRASVIFIDRYGNAVVNVTKELFIKEGKGKPFLIYFKRHEPIDVISQHYMEEEIGAPLCNFNAQGFMEIAVNLGRACDLLGLEKGDPVQIEFLV